MVALSLCACSGGDDQPSAKGDRSLAVAIVSAPNSFDPAQLADGQQSMVWGALFDNLVYRENKTGEIKPNAAESWTYSKDGKTLTFKLRDGMTFSSGDPVTAETVAGTMMRTKQTPGLQQSKFEAVTSVTASDARTVVVKFSHHVPWFLPALANAVGVIGDPETLTAERTTTNPVGSGPYVLDTAATVPGTTYVLKRREDYWNVRAYPFKSLTVRVFQDSTAAYNALQAGEINAATVRAQQLPALKSAGGFAFSSIDAQAVALLNIFDRSGEKFPPLGDVRVRRAINHAIDRRGILTSLLGGSGKVTEQIFSPYGPIYDESLNSTYGYDVAKAKQLMADAGYAKGFALQIPSTFTTTAFEPTITQQLGAIGIRLQWVQVPPQQVDATMRSGKYGIAFQVIGFGSDQGDSLNYFETTGFSNPGRYTDATLDRLTAKVDSTVDFQAAVPTYKEINKYAVEQALLAPIVFTGTTWVTRDGVKFLDDGHNGIQTVRLFG
ncbi:ABC transporter substrate-binding protein [Spirillospora sp. CA-255316]